MAEILPRYAAAVLAAAASHYPDVCTLPAVHGLVAAMDDAGATGGTSSVSSPAQSREIGEVLTDCHRVSA